MNTKVCKQCGHEWVARIAKPMKCPVCFSPKWNVGKESSTK